MRKDSIVKDFKPISVSGVHNMYNKSNFLCTNLMDIEDTININNFETNILNSELYSYNFQKHNSLNVYLDESQTKIESDSNTKWILKFDSKQLLREYLYNEIFTYNPFSEFKNIPEEQIPVGKTVNDLCKEYIEYNLLSKYKVKEFIVYVKYNSLKNDKIPGTDINILYKTPIFSKLAINPIKETISSKQYTDGIIEYTYKQSKSSQFFSFIYYYDVIYEKI
jgi:hypothetical protein